MKLLVIGFVIFCGSAIPVIVSFWGLPISFEIGIKTVIVGSALASITCAVYSLIEFIKGIKALKGAK